jgi:hypothetical protein
MWLQLTSQESDDLNRDCYVLKICPFLSGLSRHLLFENIWRRRDNCVLFFGDGLRFIKYHYSVAWPRPKEFVIIYSKLIDNIQDFHHRKHVTSRHCCCPAPSSQDKSNQIQAAYPCSKMQRYLDMRSIQHRCLLFIEPTRKFFTRGPKIKQINK